MAHASVIFEDSEDGLLVSLNFDTDLPDDPEDATEAQLQALVVFRDFMLQNGAYPQEASNEDGQGDVYEPEV